MHIYLSFAPHDTAQAVDITLALRTAGHQVNFTPRSDEVCGADWMQRIHSAELFLMLVTPTALQTDIFRAEWEYALAQKMQICLTIAEKPAKRLNIPQALADWPIIRYQSATDLAASLKAVAPEGPN